MPETVLSETKDLDNSPEIEFLSGELWSDEPELESDLHRLQIEILVRLLQWWWRDRLDFYATGNLTIYYSDTQKKSTEFRGPDFFVVKGCEKKERKSWVVKQENGLYPNVIVEILSDSTACTDRGLKKQIYQDTFCTPEYFWFDPVTLEFKGFRLINKQYQPIEPTPEGKLWSQELELYLGIEDKILRFYTTSGELVLLPEEDLAQQLEIKNQEVEQEKQRAEASLAEVERLKAILKAQGIEES